MGGCRWGSVCYLWSLISGAPVAWCVAGADWVQCSWDAASFFSVLKPSDASQPLTLPIPSSHLALMSRPPRGLSQWTAAPVVRIGETTDVFKINQRWQKYTPSLLKEKYRFLFWSFYILSHNFYLVFYILLGRYRQVMSFSVIFCLVTSFRLVMSFMLFSSC